MTSDIDLHVGKRLRRRRRLLGLTQQTLAEEVGIRFQQIQKYLGSHDPLSENEPADTIAPDVLSRKETMDLVRAYYAMDDAPRKHLLDLAKSLELANKPKLRLVSP